MKKRLLILCSLTVVMLQSCNGNRSAGTTAQIQATEEQSAKPSEQLSPAGNGILHDVNVPM